MQQTLATKASLVVLLVKIASAAVVTLEKDCRTNQDLQLDGRADEIFNGCLRDTSKAGIMLSLSEQFISWIGVEEMYLYITLTLAFIPMISWWSNPDPEIAARVNRIRFHFAGLLYCLALSHGVTIWLMAAFRSVRPCECLIPDSKEYVYVGELEDYGPWGLPNLECVAGTIVSLFLFEHYLPIPGLILLGMFPMAQMSIGYCSLLQGLIGILVGAFLHFYFARTALYMRVIDFGLNLIIGFVVLSVVKNEEESTDFSWARSFVFSLVWQVYAMSLMGIFFDAEFLIKVSRKSLTGIHQVDFINHIAIDKTPLISSNRRPTEHHAASISLLILLCGLIFFRITAKDFDSWID
eukprot:TRINITY_DN8571_c0_g1_i10.p1 TRINITY_DN8571_c0_g1~~TRINITY_DN8571_c0_g1_i10.p1  ORF type:complete len:352 (-),score=72.72 TRINITY_DN8571_c0_g1_i10:301-1356(-)